VGLGLGGVICFNFFLLDKRYRVGCGRGKEVRVVVKGRRSGGAVG